MAISLLVSINVIDFLVINSALTISNMEIRLLQRVQKRLGIISGPIDDFLHILLWVPPKNIL